MTLSLADVKLESLRYIFVADSVSLASFDLMLLTLEKSDMPTVKNDKKLHLNVI